MSERKNHTKRETQQKILLKFIDGPVKLLIRHNVTPNILSYLGFLFSLTTAILLAFDSLHFPFWIAWITPFIFFWSGALDVFDGEVARRTNSNSMVGAFLDSNLDRLSDAVIVIGLILGNYIHYILGYIMLFLILMISYIRSKAESQGINMRGIGFMERAERLIILWFLFIGEIEIYFFTNLVLGYHFTLFIPISMIVFTILLLLTVIQRIVFSLKKLRKIDAQNIN